MVHNRTRSRPGGSGCKQEDDDGAERRSPPPVVQGSLELEDAQAGAPDTGTRGSMGRPLRAAGDGGGRPDQRPGATGLGTGGARRRVGPAAGMRSRRRTANFSALLPDLPREGVVRFQLIAGAGRAEPWRTEIVASREPRGGPPETVRVPGVTNRRRSRRCSCATAIESSARSTPCARPRRAAAAATPRADADRADATRTAARAASASRSDISRAAATRW